MQIRKCIAGGGIIALGLAGNVQPAAADPTEILFVGNSFTHGRYPPALNFDAGSATSTGSSVVHDLLSANPAENPAPSNPSQNPPPGSLSAQLNYLQNNPAAQYSEVGPYSGVAGIFLQFTKEAGLNYDVSLMSVSSATLTGYLNNSKTGSEAGDLPIIEQSKWNTVVLQDQSFQPLPTTVNVNGQSVPTRGNPTSFASGVAGLVQGIDSADKTTKAPYANIFLAETPPLAAYGFTSSNPAEPIFGTSTLAYQQSINNPLAAEYAPYLGDADPMQAMASDLHNAYYGEAAAINGKYGSSVQASPDGDAWITAMKAGLAETNPYLVNEPAGQIDLWDSDPLNACCTTPVGYHPSVYGDYLNAAVLFEEVTGVSPLSLSAEFGPNNAGSAAAGLGISPTLAFGLAQVAQATVVPEPASLALVGVGLAAVAGLRRRRR